MEMPMEMMYHPRYLKMSLSLSLSLYIYIYLFISVLMFVESDSQQGIPEEVIIVISSFRPRLFNIKCFSIEK